MFSAVTAAGYAAGEEKVAELLATQLFWGTEKGWDMGWRGKGVSRSESGSSEYKRNKGMHSLWEEGT